MSIDRLRLQLAELGVDVRQPGNNTPPSKSQSYRQREGVDDCLCGMLHGTDDSDVDDVLDVVNKRLESEQTEIKVSKSQRREQKTELSLQMNLQQRRRNANSPLGSVLAQYKEAERHWAKEKAALRREATKQRQRAHKLDLENRRLVAGNKHKAVDINALKNALSARDGQLQTMQDKINKYEGLLTESQETRGQETADIVYERDELRNLLLSTMERMREIDDFINRTLSNTSHLEQKLEELQTQRINALQAASKSHSLKKELEGARRQLSLQSDVLQRVSDIQLKRNRKQKEVIQDILQFDHLKDQETSSPQVLNDDLKPVLESILGDEEL